MCDNSPAGLSDAEFDYHHSGDSFETWIFEQFNTQLKKFDNKLTASHIQILMKYIIIDYDFFHCNKILMSLDKVEYQKFLAQFCELYNCCGGSTWHGNQDNNIDYEKYFTEIYKKEDENNEEI